MREFLRKTRWLESLKAIFGLAALAGFFLPWVTVKGCNPEGIVRPPPVIGKSFAAPAGHIGFSLFPAPAGEGGGKVRMETYDGLRAATHDLSGSVEDFIVLGLVAGFPFLTVLLALYFLGWADSYRSFWPVFQFFFGLVSLAVMAQVCIFVLLEEQAIFHLGIVLTAGGNLIISLLGLSQMAWSLFHTRSAAE